MSPAPRVPKRCGVRHRDLGVLCIRRMDHAGRCWTTWERSATEGAVIRVEWLSTGDGLTRRFFAGCPCRVQFPANAEGAPRPETEDNPDNDPDDDPVADATGDPEC